VELIPAENGLYELVGSNLNNFAMPLLRYRTYDLVELPEPGYQCPCGSSYRVIRNLVGRKPNYIMTPDGRMIGNAPSNILKGVDHILEVQFHQRTPDAIQLYVVPTPGYSTETRHKLIKNTQKYTSVQLQVEVIEVDHITRGPNGKFSNLISELV
jgi:phenylacetate-CoA ligase